jgi:hypothetical protein
MERAIQVDGDGLMPLIVGHGFDQLIKVEAGAGDRHVRVTERFATQINGRIAIGRPGHVGLARDHALASGVQAFREVLDTRLLEVAQHQACAMVEEGLGVARLMVPFAPDMTNTLPVKSSIVVSLCLLANLGLLSQEASQFRAHRGLVGVQPQPVLQRHDALRDDPVHAGHRVRAGGAGLDAQAGRFRPVNGVDHVEVRDRKSVV